MGRIFCLLLVTSSMLGCGEEPIQEEPGPPPKVVDATVKEGASIPSNAIITMTFDEEMGSVDISVSCTAGATELDNSRREATWVFKPYSPPGFEMLPWALWCDIPPGPHTLMVTGKDMFGQELQEFTPINFIVVGPD